MSLQVRYKGIVEPGVLEGSLDLVSTVMTTLSGVIVLTHL